MALHKLPTRQLDRLLVAAEFQYNDKKYVAMERTPFELNFRRYPWKKDLMVQTGIPRVEEFLIGIQKS